MGYICKYSDSDWEQVCEIYNQSKPDEMNGLVDPTLIVPLEKDDNMISYFKESKIWIYKSEKQIKGFIGLKGNVISWLFVHPEHRRQGIARTLLAKISEENNDYLILNVTKNNYAALCLYENFGFKIYEEFTGKMYGKKIPAVRMKLTKDNNNRTIVRGEIMNNIFDQLEEINQRPELFQFYTAEDLWTDEYISKQMLVCHLNPDIDVSSRREEFIDRSVEWIASHFDPGDDTRIADFGCGPGLYTSRLANLGVKVTGIDFSKRSIEYARGIAEKSGLNIEYVNKNYLEFETEQRFNLIMMIMCDYCVLSPSQRKVMLTKFHQFLVPGGAVLLDVYSLNAFQQRKEASSFGKNLLDGFWSEQPYYEFQNTFKYEDEKVVLDKYTIVEEDRTRVIYNWLQYFSPESLQGEFEEAGFRKFELYADVAGAPFDQTSSEFAIVGRK